MDAEPPKTQGDNMIKPNIIDEAIERLDVACATDSKINTGDVALLLKAFTTSRRMVQEQIAQLTAANARIAELEAWKNAVPVEAIMTFFDSGDRCTQEQIDAIDTWLNTQVQP